MIRELQDATATVDGLKLRITGDEIRAFLEQRIDAHRRRAERWAFEKNRTPEDQTEENPLLPEHMCENEAERSHWRADRLKFIREHIDPSRTYLLGEADLAFGELLPETPRSVEQEEYEERTGVAFNLERLTKRLGDFGAIGYSAIATEALRMEQAGGLLGS